jgi:hypothetical protein
MEPMLKVTATLPAVLFTGGALYIFGLNIPPGWST